MVCIQGMFIFSDYVPQAHISHQLGYIFIYFVAFNILVNFSVLFAIVGSQILRAVKTVFKKFKNRKSTKTRVNDKEMA